MNVWLRTGLVAGFAVAVCLGAYVVRQRPEVESPRTADRVEEDPIPMQLTDGGWRLTRDCTLAFDPPAIIQTSPSGKFITAPAVGLVPTNRAGPTHTVRSTAGTEVRMDFAPIPLKLSKSMPLSENKFLLTENDDPDRPVTTMVIPEGTRIMPEQRVEIVDRAGKVVWKQPG